jgi:hypothetical protein
MKTLAGMLGMFYGSLLIMLPLTLAAAVCYRVFQWLVL